MPNTKYTINKVWNNSGKVSNGIFSLLFINDCSICVITALYENAKINNEIRTDISPINIPSTINGHLINPFVAPTYFIIDISFLLACTVNFIVFEIINIDTNINITNITPEIVFTPFAILINALIVSSLVCISNTFSNLLISSRTSLLFSKFVRVTT